MKKIYVKNLYLAFNVFGFYNNYFFIHYLFKHLILYNPIFVFLAKNTPKKYSFVF